MNSRTLPPAPARRGFTLVEIVLALGLISFALVGIFGLLSMAATSSNNSNRDTVMVSMHAQVMNSLRSVPFEALWLADPVAQANTALTPVERDTATDATVQVGVDTTFYFDEEGTRVADKSTIPAPIYECIVTKYADPDSIGYKLDTGKYLHNAVNLRIVFTWPYSAPKEKRQTVVSYAKIARY